MKAINMKTSVVIALAILSLGGCKKARYGILKPEPVAEVTTGFTNQNSSFKFEASRGTTSPEKPVSFKGTCTSPQKTEITWDFGDKSATATGTEVTHSYKDLGTYTVTGTCTLANGHSLPETVEIIVRAEDTHPGSKPNPGQSPDQGTGPVQSKPSPSNPVQNKPVVSDPGQH